MPCERCWKQNPADVHTCTPKVTVLKDKYSNISDKEMYSVFYKAVISAENPRTTWQWCTEILIPKRYLKEFQKDCRDKWLHYCFPDESESKFFKL